MCMPQTALRATLYGNKTRIDVARLQRLASGFSRFTVDGLPGSTATVPPAQVRTARLRSRAVPSVNSVAVHHMRLQLALGFEHLPRFLCTSICAAAADGGWRSSPTAAAARQERAGGAAAGVCAAGQLRGRAVCRGAGTCWRRWPHILCRFIENRLMQ